MELKCVHNYKWIIRYFISENKILIASSLIADVWND